jgi:hypothetical protein
MNNFFKKKEVKKLNMVHSKKKKKPKIGMQKEIRKSRAVINETEP